MSALRNLFAALRDRLFPSSDEIDWETRSRLEKEAQQEMEALWGPGLVGLREHAERIKKRWDIVKDTTLTEPEKLAKIQALLPDTTAEQLKALLRQAQEVREEEEFLSDPTISFQEKRKRLQAAHPDATEEQIKAEIESNTKG